MLYLYYKKEREKMDITLVVLVLIIIACLIGLDWECGYEYMIPKKWRKKKMREQMYAYYAFGGQLMGIYPSEWDAKWASRLRDPSDNVEIKIVYVTIETE